MVAEGAGVRLRLHQSALLGPGHALQFDLGLTVKPRLNVQCLLERNTIAAGRGILNVREAFHGSEKTVQVPLLTIVAVQW